MEIANTKWVAATASMWIESVIGASYTFGIYSSLLKSSQSYDQSTLDTVSVYKDIGMRCEQTRTIIKKSKSIKEQI